MATENIHTYPNQREVIGKFKRERESKKKHFIFKKRVWISRGIGGTQIKKNTQWEQHICHYIGHCLLIWIPSISFAAKSQELKKDIEILSQTFERVIDRKEAIIKSLVKDIEEAEEQYQMALRSHLQNVDRLIGKWRHMDRMALNKYLPSMYIGNSYHIQIVCSLAPVT